MNQLKTIAIAVALMGFSIPAFADTPPMNYGIVDMNKVMQTTDAAKGIFTELEGKRKEFQAQIAKEEDTLRNAEQTIVKQKDTLTKDDFDKKKKEFETKVANAQKMVQERKHTLDEVYNDSMTKMRRESAKVVAEIAKEKGFSTVFTQDAVIMATPNLDITDEVVTRLNKSVKKIPVDWSVAGKADKK